MDEGLIKSVIQSLRKGPYIVNHDSNSIDYVYLYDLMEEAADLLEILSEQLKDIDEPNLKP